MPPPTQEALLEQLFGRADRDELLPRILSLYGTQGVAEQPYLPWDKIRYKTPPEGFSTEHWWLTLKFARAGMRRRLPLVDVKGAPFVYALPDEVLQQTDYIARCPFRGPVDLRLCIDTGPPREVGAGQEVAMAGVNGVAVAEKLPRRWWKCAPGCWPAGKGCARVMWDVLRLPWCVSWVRVWAARACLRGRREWRR
jgi:hypothetical protein